MDEEDNFAGNVEKLELAKYIDAKFTVKKIKML